MPKLANIEEIDLDITDALAQLREPICTVEKVLTIKTEIVLKMLHESNHMTISRDRYIAFRKFVAEYILSNNKKENIVQLPYNPIGTGFQGIDNALNGGFQNGSVFEILGDSGVGKSHFCYSIAAFHLMMRSNTTVMIISSSKVPSKCLLSAFEGVCKRNSLSNESNKVKECLSRLQVSTVFDPWKLMEVLSSAFGTSYREGNFFFLLSLIT